MSDRARFAIALVAAIPLALLALEFGLLAMVGALLAGLLIGLGLGRLAFAGAMISIGGTWAVVFFLAAQECDQPGQPCGATPLDLTPHIVVSLVIAGIGLVAAIVSRRRSGRTAGGL